MHLLMSIKQHFFILATQITVDSRTLSKVLHLVQKNAGQLKELTKSYRGLQNQYDTQKEQLEEILKLLNESAESSTVVVTNKGKGKGKAKAKEEFYQVSIRTLVYYLIFNQR
jgi:allophanate hydrolase subunit 1